MRALGVLRIVGSSVIVAWFVATTSATAAALLAYLNMQELRGPAVGFLQLLLTVLWLPAKLSDKMLGFAIQPYHSAEDVVVNIVAYTLETFLVTVVVVILFRLFWRRVSWTHHDNSTVRRGTREPAPRV